MQNSILKIPLEIILLIIILAGCKDRVVTDLDFRYDLNRPGVSHVTPVEEAINVPQDIDIVVWFNKEMNNASVEANFYLYPIISMDTLHTITFAPENSDIVYAAGQKNGIFKSEDKGENWRWLTQSIPNISGRSVLAGVGESYLLAGTEQGLYHSTNSGENWEFISGLDEQPINHLVSDPSNHNVIYAAVGTDGVYKSEDGGLTWNLSSSGLRSGVNFPHLTIDPVDHNTLYVTTENDFIYKSEDSGDSWQQIRVGLGHRSFSSLIVSSSNPNLIYSGSLGGGVYHSDNGGDNWEFTNDDFEEPVLSLAFDPADNSIIYAGTELGMYRSTNGGENWLQFDTFDDEGSVFSIATTNDSDELIITGFIDGAYIYNRNDDRFERSSEVLIDNITVPGSMDFEIWNDTLTVISPLDYHQQETEVDTTTFSPFVPTRALQAWEAQGRSGEPPVDIDPDATKMTFEPGISFLNGYRYQILIRGSFEVGGNIFREVRGAEDLNGNSLETDSRSSFTVEP